MRPVLNPVERKDRRTAGARARHRVALDAFAAVAEGGTVEAEVQGGTGTVTAANNSKIYVSENCQIQTKHHGKSMRFK